MRKRIAWNAAPGLASAMSHGAASARTIVLGMKGPEAGTPFWAAVERGTTDKAAEPGLDGEGLAGRFESCRHEIEFRRPYS